MSINLDKRIEVLSYSLFLERHASHNLAFLLDIDANEIDQSKSLGNSSTSLSFSQKIHLLLDNKSITKDEKQKFIAFMNIRNQMIHNFKSSTYEQGVGNVDGLLGYLKRTYPEYFESSQIEPALSNCVNKLFEDGIETLQKFEGGIAKKIRTESERDVYQQRCDNLYCNWIRNQ